MDADTFSKDAKTTPDVRLNESVGNLFQIQYLIGMFFVGVILLVYYLRDPIWIMYNTYVSSSVKQFVGEMLLKMHLSPAGEFVTTYIPNVDSVTETLGLSSPTINEISLDDIAPV
jgi:hypothetical protein